MKILGFPIHIVTSEALARREDERKKALHEARTINNGILTKLLKHNLKLEVLLRQYCPDSILKKALK